VQYQLSGIDQANVSQADTGDADCAGSSGSGNDSKGAAVAVAAVAGATVVAVVVDVTVGAARRRGARDTAGAVVVADAAAAVGAASAISGRDVVEVDVGRAGGRIASVGIGGSFTGPALVLEAGFVADATRFGAIWPIGVGHAQSTKESVGGSPRAKRGLELSEVLSLLMFLVPSPQPPLCGVLRVNRDGHSRQAARAQRHRAAENQGGGSGAGLGTRGRKGAGARGARAGSDRTSGQRAPRQRKKLKTRVVSEGYLCGFLGIRPPWRYCSCARACRGSFAEWRVSVPDVAGTLRAH